MLAAKRDVAVVAADLGLLAAGDCMAFRVDAQVHRRLAPALAHRLQFDKRVRQRQKRRRAGEELALEVRPETVAQHWNAQPVRHLAQLEHVALRQELRLIDEDAVELALLQLVGDRLEKVDTLVIAVRRSRKRDARADSAGTRAVVMRRGPQHRFHAALAIVEVGLQQGCRFPSVHRRIVEIELGHLNLQRSSKSCATFSERRRRSMWLLSSKLSSGINLSLAAYFMRTRWATSRWRKAVFWRSAFSTASSSSPSSGFTNTVAWRRSGDMRTSVMLTRCVCSTSSWTSPRWRSSLSTWRTCSPTRSRRTERPSGVSLRRIRTCPQCRRSADCSPGRRW